MTHDEMISVIAAHRDGKQIQYLQFGDKEWRDCARNEPSWDFHACSYRVKPEPRVLWAAYYNDGGLYAVRLSESALLEFLGDDAANTKIKKFVEVTE